MAKRKNGNAIGGWAFLVGAILAIVLGAFGPLNQTWLWILVIIGIIVGLLNVAEEESTPFLMSGTVLIIASAFGGDVLSVVSIFSGITDALLAILVPATIIVALRSAFSLARR